MSEIKALPIVEYNPGKVLQSTHQYIVQRINSGRLKLYRLIVNDPTNPALPYILQTAATITTYIEIPATHRLLKVGWSHTTIAPNTASVDSLTYIFSSENFGAEIYPVAYDAYTGTAATHYVELEGFGYEEPAHRYVISTNTTATDRVYMWVDVEIISEEI